MISFKDPITEEVAHFDEDEAQLFKEDTFWDGNNHVSKITGSQWSHEAIYFTKNGNFILNSYSQVQGATETYTRITAEDACYWLVACGYPFEDFPGDSKDYFDSCEI